MRQGLVPHIMIIIPAAAMISLPLLRGAVADRAPRIPQMTGFTPESPKISILQFFQVAGSLARVFLPRGFSWIFFEGGPCPCGTEDSKPNIQTRCHVGLAARHPRKKDTMGEGGTGRARGARQVEGIWPRSRHSPQESGQSSTDFVLFRLIVF